MSAPGRILSTRVLAQHYEKIAVLAVLLALLASTLILLIRIGEARQAIERARWDPEVPERPLAEVDMRRFERMLESIRDPYQVAILDRNMMISELRVTSINPENIPAPIPIDAEVCPFTNYEQPGMEHDTTGDGIPDEWYVSYGLDPFDTTLAGRDVDGDGFTVREEYQWGTSPIDPQDHPPHATKLRLQEVRQRPFDLTFQGIQDFGEEDVMFQLNSRVRDRTYFVRKGEEVEGFTVVDFEPRVRTRPDGRRVDESLLVLQREDRTMRLVVDRPVQEFERNAIIISLIDDAEFRVQIDDTFAYRDQEYIIVDIRRDSVLIRDTKLDEEFEIREVQPGDLEGAFAPEEDEQRPADFPFDWPVGEGNSPE